LINSQYVDANLALLGQCVAGADSAAGVPGMVYTSHTDKPIIVLLESYWYNINLHFTYSSDMTCANDV